MNVRQRRAEMMTLHCERCTFGTEFPLEHTAVSCVLACQHCGASLHWHVCPQCSMGYRGGPEARCPLCDGEEELLG